MIGGAHTVAFMRAQAEAQVSSTPTGEAFELVQCSCRRAWELWDERAVTVPGKREIVGVVLADHEPYRPIDAESRWSAGEVRANSNGVRLFACVEAQAKGDR